VFLTAGRKFTNKSAGQYQEEAGFAAGLAGEARTRERASEICRKYW
jgi:hypothetical protein